MSSGPSENESSSSKNSSSSDESMLTPPQSPRVMEHPFLPLARASTISSWRSSIPERISRSNTASDAEGMSRDAAIEAYQQLKLAIDQIDIGQIATYANRVCQENNVSTRKQIEAGEEKSLVGVRRMALCLVLSRMRTATLGIGTTIYSRGMLQADSILRWDLARLSGRLKSTSDLGTDCTRSAD
ncbi:hypothetical protein K491DRAFT_42971 [Lophiostoma macrostomum CBS 122681]|uniref:Uncharacterized protein n=1 Tax=Lophiostoma macrostomum CBS 122681 TaxID=1314788 RepID=A0A6A6SYJ5_9PLEO|nr:hypothetical protein K491DRAFT_42971 [Lophiostoma macrostomum CBS 122681]